MGRKQVPTALKKLRGNPGKRPLNEREPQPEGLIGTPPSNFTSVEKAVWADTVAAMPNVYTAADRALMEAWCTVVAQFRKVRAELNRGEMVLVDPSGATVRHPYTTILRELRDQI